MSPLDYLLLSILWGFAAFVYGWMVTEIAARGGERW